MAESVLQVVVVGVGEWIVFKRALGVGKVLLTMESKRRAKTEPLTPGYFNDHKKKVCIASAFVVYMPQFYSLHCLPLIRV